MLLYSSLQNQITSCTFNVFHTPLVVAGTYWPSSPTLVLVDSKRIFIMLLTIWEEYAFLQESRFQNVVQLQTWQEQELLDLISFTLPQDINHLDCNRKNNLPYPFCVNTVLVAQTRCKRCRIGNIPIWIMTAIQTSMVVISDKEPVCTSCFCCSPVLLREMCGHRVWILVALSAMLT